MTKLEARRRSPAGEHPTAACRWYRYVHRPRRRPQAGARSTEGAGGRKRSRTLASDMPALRIHAATMGWESDLRAGYHRSPRAATQPGELDLPLRCGMAAFGAGVRRLSARRRCASDETSAVRRHRPGSLQRVVFAVHGDAAERAFSAAIQARRRYTAPRR